MILSEAIRINHFPAHQKALNIEMSQPIQKAPDGVFKMLSSPLLRQAYEKLSPFIKHIITNLPTIVKSL